ncbi:ATP-binding protein, partial [Glycomyces halotolerans]
MNYPFSALVGQDRLSTALLLGAVDPRIGGVLVRGSKGSAKSTAVRGLAALLPDIATRVGCSYNCPPDDPAELCPSCADAPEQWRPTPLVELPLGASEDRLIGSIDLERALADGWRSFQPGLLARAHRGLLYVDEVNLLDDHLVDALLDAAAMGWNHVEREGVSARHAARFQLVGTMNPEEGELRPQLLDRFGLTVEVTAPADPAERAEVVRRRLAFDADPERFAERFEQAEKRLTERLAAARALLGQVGLPESWLVRIAEVCAAFEVEGLRADIVTARAATALAAWDGRTEVTRADVRTACLLALPHRRRRGPFDDPGIDENELDRLLGDDEPEPPESDEDGPDDGGGPDQTGPAPDGPAQQAHGDRPDGPAPQPTEPHGPTGDHGPAPVDRVEAPTEAAAPHLITAPQRRK